MAEFFNVLPPDAARALLFDHLRGPIGVEQVATEEALGRVTAEALRAPHALPAFRRSAMDGYAVRAADTYGASPSLPALLRVVGEVKMGQAANVAIGPGEAALVHTGGMVPDTADAVTPVEHTQPVGESRALPFEIEVFSAMAAGQHVLQVGEDVRSGELILAAGHLVRPQDIGGLLALGIVEIAVARRPRVALLATGDEVVHPSRPVGPGQVRDINSYTTAGQTRQAGGIPVLEGVVADRLDDLLAAAAAALAEHDMLVMSAGSSVSVRDMTRQVIARLGRPGVLAHGIAVKPGKPTIVGAVDGKPVLGLPGNPVSAMITFGLLGVPAIQRLQGLTGAPLRGVVWARAGANIASESGREDYVPVRLEETAGGLTAYPVFGKSNLIYVMVRADGLLKVPLNAGGVAAGETAEVRLF